MLKKFPNISLNMLTCKNMWYIQSKDLSVTLLYRSSKNKRGLLLQGSENASACNFQRFGLLLSLTFMDSIHVNNFYNFYKSLRRLSKITLTKIINLTDKNWQYRQYSYWQWSSTLQQLQALTPKFISSS